MRNENIGSDGVLFDITSDQSYDVYVPVIIDAAEETRTDAGAVSVATYFTNLVTTGGTPAITLADGTIEGQLKKITMTADAGTATLTIASPVDTDTDTIAFADVGDTAELVWNGTAWRILATYNVASGDAGPAVA